jgi:hypothetical protein
MKKVNKAQQIREYITANPNAKGTDVAKKFKVGTAYVYQIRHGMKPKKVNISAKEESTLKELAYSVGRPKSRMQASFDRKLPEVGDSVGGLTLTRKISDDGNGYAYRWVRDSMVESGEVPVDSSEDPRIPKFDNINHPAHYRAGGIETIDFIEAKDLNYRLGNAVKYITRAKHKGNELEDLKKAQWYLNREIDKLTGETK